MSGAAEVAESSATNFDVWTERKKERRQGGERGEAGDTNLVHLLVQILAIVPLIASTGAEEVFAVARRRGAGHVGQKQITICTHKWPVLKDEGLDCKENRRWQFRLDTNAQIEMEAN